MAYQINNRRMEFKPIALELEHTSTVSLSKKLIKLMAVLFIALFSFQSTAQDGEAIFTKNCAACHALSDKTLVGPGLAGLSDRRDIEWSKKWILNSTELIASGDKDAIDVFKKFNEVAMTSFPDLTDEELTGLLTYIDENQVASGGDTAATVTNDSPGKTPMDTDLILWGLLILVALGFWLVRFLRKVKADVSDVGIHPDAHKVSNYPAIFALFVIIAVTVIYVLMNLLAENKGMINVLMFVVLPYVAFAIFLVGSIYRYTKRGFQVSSLSSQFIEGKKLFWGSQPFHWGILVLFCGHLLAFMFPRAILAWNGVPVRLMILEISSFAFGLAALFGLVLLIKRRLTNKSLLVVTNKMDMVVYVVLLTQIVSGLGVAFFVRWGSSWFSSTLTPYLRSIFSFDPDISAVAEMPWWIQLHIISAFIIIAIIPFTRFMHFLVAPVDYAWRKYQLVIWNWNRKEIRKSKQHTFGKKPRNH
jgi:nitrate reductase gamma subunit